MVEHLTGAMFFASWTSIIWAPLAMGMAVWIPRYRSIVALAIGAALIVLFSSLAIYHSSGPDCEILQQPEIFTCREGGIARAILQATMIGAALVSSIILLVGWLISRKRETRKVAH